MDEKRLNRLISETVRKNLLEFKVRNIISEENNPAYNRMNRGDSESLARLWDVIEKKQADLQKEVFGDLSNGILDIANEKAKAMGREYLHVPYTVCRAGNKKLPPSVLIINMSSSLMCPSYYFGLCTIKNGACYAQNDENQHSAKKEDSNPSKKKMVSVLQNRWETDLMHTQMLQQYQQGNKKPMNDYFKLVETYIQLGNAYAAWLTRKAVEDTEYREGRSLSEEEKKLIRSVYNKYKITDVRLNETGDFHCQLAVDLWANFAEKIKKRYSINMHTYTARNLDFSRASQVMAVNASHSNINVGNSNERKFMAVEEDYYNSLVGGDRVKNRQPILGFNGNVYFYKCPCEQNKTQCNRCGVCFEQNKTGKPYTIFVKYHARNDADGLKNLFKKGEIEGTIEKLHQNGWVTDDEYQTYSSDRHQDFLNKLDKKIDNQRMKAEKEQAKKVKIKNKKKK